MRLKWLENNKSSSYFKPVHSGTPKRSWSQHQHQTNIVRLRWRQESSVMRIRTQFSYKTREFPNFTWEPFSRMQNCKEGELYERHAKWEIEEKAINNLISLKYGTSSRDDWPTSLPSASKIRTNPRTPVNFDRECSCSQIELVDWWHRIGWWMDTLWKKMASKWKRPLKFKNLTWDLHSRTNLGQCKIPYHFESFYLTFKGVNIYGRRKRSL